MNKIIFFILIVVGMSYGQAGNPVVDSLTAHRSAITTNASNIATNVTNIDLKANKASPIFTGSGTAQGLDVTGTFELDGTAITATATELNHVDGVTGAIQTQLDTKETKTNHDTLATDVQTNTSAISSINTNIGSQIQDSIYADVGVWSVSVLYPSANDTIPLLRLPFDATITSVYAGIKGGTSATYNVGWHTSLLGTLEEVFASDEVCSSSIGATAGGGLENDVPDSGEWIQLHVSAVSGTVKSLIVTITYTKR